MTNTKRAEKLVTEFNKDGACLSNTDETVLERLIVAELDAVEKEARADTILKMSQREHAYHVQPIAMDAEIHGWRKQRVYSQDSYGGKMNNRERAERLYLKLLTPESSLEFSDPTDLIAIELEAVAKECIDECDEDTDLAKAEVWREALEEAAKICDEKQKEFDGTHSICDILATEIRSLAKNTETK